MISDIRFSLVSIECRNMSIYVCGLPPAAMHTEASSRQGQEQTRAEIPTGARNAEASGSRASGRGVMSCICSHTLFPCPSPSDKKCALMGESLFFVVGVLRVEIP
jgi:hypothetical protein